MVGVSMKKKFLIILLIILIIMLIGAIIGYFKLNNVLNDNIKNGTMEWYNDHDGEYDKTSIGALMKNGYIKSNKSLLLKKNLDCNIVNIKDNMAYITKNKDCDFDKEVKKIPTIYINFLNDNNDIIKTSSSNDWIKNYKLSFKFKNDVYKESDIKTIKFYGNEDVLLENNVIKNDFLDDKYIMELCMNDGECFEKNMYLRVDNTAPVYQRFEVSDNSFEGIYTDEESGVRDVYYYISEKDETPTNLTLFLTQEQLIFDKDVTYYIWAIAYNNAGVRSDISYLGTYKKEVNDTQSGSSKGSGGSTTKSKE